jgi:hypothetical protein
MSARRLVFLVEFQRVGALSARANVRAKAKGADASRRRLRRMNKSGQAGFTRLP